ncbi:MAG: tail fiber domain-containing protein [Cyclobacteriaceae bacterium]|nr:tail fiber domain-containing protein [Cyclobacteriaceae bacterium]
MKTYLVSIILIVVSFFFTNTTIAQNLGFTYQAVAIDKSQSEGFGRDSQGEVLANRDIDLRFTILEGNENGPEVYQETHIAKTDVFGIFRLIVGRGNISFGNRLEDLNWGEISYFMQVEIDLGNGYEFLGVEELLGSPYALNAKMQNLTLNNNELSISGGNSVVLSDNDPTNELVQGVTLSGSILTLTDAGGDTSVDLSTLPNADNSNTNELQTISKTGSTVTLSNSGGSFTDAVNDADFDPANEIQDLQLVGNNLTITNNGTATTIDLSPYSGGAFTTTANVTSNAPGDYTTDDFVVGSPQLDDNGNATNDFRMFFDKSKGAFRAGFANGTQWDDANRGLYSVAMGESTVASGQRSTATGNSTIASGNFSTAMGSNSVASGEYSTVMGLSTTASEESSTAMGNGTRASGINSTAMGSGTTASGINSTAMGATTIASGGGSIAMGANGTVASGFVSTAMGYTTTASGDYSTTMGNRTTSRSFAETTPGAWNTDYTPNSATTFNTTDRLFVIGNGQNGATRSDALIIYKSGNAILNGLLTLDGDNAGTGAAYTLPAQDGTANQVIATDGAGTLNWAAGSGGAFTTTTNITSNAPGDYTTDDFVFGSPQLDDDGDANNDARMFFDKSKAAFRAGIVDGTQWDDANRGEYSVAMGVNTTASGDISIAMGEGTIASGNRSTAMGFNTISSGWSSTAMGERTTASSNRATALGNGTTASGFSSTAMGNTTTASGDNATAMGLNTTASGRASTAMGERTNASGHRSTAMGFSTIASSFNSTAMGNGTTASGDNATAMGFNTFARSLSETTIGIFNTDYTPNSTIGFNVADRLFVVGNGNSNIGRSDALIIYKNGNGTLAGTLTQLSDARLKQEVMPLAASLTKLRQLQGVHYKWNAVRPHDMESLQTGLIAQEIEKILPELVKEASDGYKSVNYVGLIPHLIEAVKELEAKNALLEQESSAKIKSLEERLLRLEKLIEGK